MCLILSKCGMVSIRRRVTALMTIASRRFSNMYIYSTVGLKEPVLSHTHRAREKDLCRSQFDQIARRLRRLTAYVSTDYIQATMSLSLPVLRILPAREAVHLPRLRRDFLPSLLPRHDVEGAALSLDAGAVLCDK